MSQAIGFMKMIRLSLTQGGKQMSKSNARPCVLRFNANGNDYEIEYPSIYQAKKAITFWVKKSKLKDIKIVVS